MTSNFIRMSTIKQIPSRISRYLAPVISRLRRLTRRDIALLLAAVPALMLLYVLALIPFTPSISDIRKAASEQPAQILSADGKKLTEFKQSNRVWVRLSDISPHVIEALIATEDHRFYTHFGIDWRRTAAAAINTFHGDRQGGSTLTQQLARNIFPEEIGRAPTLTRKLKEAITALKIEAVHSKNDILETYLNTVPFLYNAFGIEMAARTYFDTRAEALDVLQSATLVGMLKGNSYYNPVLNPERALERRNLVLAQMVKHQKLTQARFEVLKKRPLRINFERQSEEPGAAPHFAQQLRKWLIAWADRHDYNIFTDGLVVVTTLDSRLQNQANLAVSRQGSQLQQLANADWSKRPGWSPGNPLVQTFMRETPEYRAVRASGLSHEKAMKQLQADASFMHKLRRQKTTIQTGLLAIDPRNGQIKAWVGSRNFAEDAFDHVQQARRQPGSTFKPFVYGEAFRQGRRPDETLIDQEVEIAVGDQELWRPSDDQPPSGKAFSLRDGLVYSKNTITAQLMQTTGPANVAKLARAMGIRQSKLEAVPSLALGTSPVSLKEMVAAYGTIANGGDFIEPVLVTRIEDRHGRLLEAFAAAPERALPRQVAYTLLDVMRGVIDKGTGAGIRSRFGIRADVAGKTGTTQEHADGWFILMHPQLVAGAWVGFNDNRVTLNSAYWGQGAHSALPIVGDFVGNALNSRLIDAAIRFEAPDETGLLQRLFRRLKGWFSEHFTSKPAGSKATHPAKPAAATLVPEQPQAAPDPLQEKIDQIIAEERAKESAGETPAAPLSTPPAQSP
jgi:penicillin-binding protein 1A